MAAVKTFDGDGFWRLFSIPQFKSPLIQVETLYDRSYSLALMKFPTPLIPATLIQRYKRFLADAEMPGGDLLTVHCANPGAMLGLNAPGLKIWVSDSGNPKRKLRHSWELAQIGAGLVGINTALPNRIAEEAILAGRIPELSGYGLLTREVSYGAGSRIDLLLKDPERGKCYVEIKNVHLMRQEGLAEFPDSRTARGARHLSELAGMVKQGHRAVLLYVVQREDCDRFAIARDIDPVYAQAQASARAAGVELICYDCQISTQEIRLRGALPVKD